MPEKTYSLASRTKMREGRPLFANFQGIMPGGSRDHSAWPTSSAPDDNEEPYEEFLETIRKIKTDEE